MDNIILCIIDEISYYYKLNIKIPYFKNINIFKLNHNILEHYLKYNNKKKKLIHLINKLFIIFYLIY